MELFGNFLAQGNESGGDGFALRLGKDVFIFGEDHGEVGNIAPTRASFYSEGGALEAGLKRAGVFGEFRGEALVDEFKFVGGKRGRVANEFDMHRGSNGDW